MKLADKIDDFLNESPKLREDPEKFANKICELEMDIKRARESGVFFLLPSIYQLKALKIHKFYEDFMK